MFSWLFVDLNSYFASVEQELRPELRFKPIGIVPMMADTTSCLAASYEAKVYGVKTGTSVRDARKMCPGIQFVEARHEHYVTYHHKIIEAVESCLPVTAVCSIDEVACKLTGRDRNEKNAVELAYQVKQTIREKVGMQLKCSVGIAPNRYLSKVAADMQKPDGLTVLRQEDLPKKLFKLKLQDFPGIGRRMDVRLRQFGVTSVEQLFSLTKIEMSKIWGGIVGEKFFNWIRGIDIEVPGYFESADGEPQKSVGHSHVLAPSLRNEKDAWAVAQKLTHKTCSRLRRYKLWARRFGLYLSYKEYKTWGDDLRLVECQDDFSILESLTRLWEMAPHKDEIIKIAVVLYDLVEDAEHTLSLFGDERRNHLVHALDHIHEKYGKSSLYFGGVHSAKSAAPTRIAFSSIPDVEDL